MFVTTVKELKEFLSTIPDNTPLKFFNYDDRDFVKDIGIIQFKKFVGVFEKDDDEYVKELNND